MPTHAHLATPIHARLVRDADGRQAIRVRFISRVTISNLRGEFQLAWHEPGTAPGSYAAGPIDEGASAGYNGLIPQGRNIAAGQALTKTFDLAQFGHRMAPGVLTGSVTLNYATGPLIQAEEDTAKIPVGTFQIRIP